MRTIAIAGLLVDQLTMSNCCCVNCDVKPYILIYYDCFAGHSRKAVVSEPSTVEPTHEAYPPVDEYACSSRSSSETDSDDDFHLDPRMLEDRMLGYAN